MNLCIFGDIVIISLNCDFFNIFIIGSREQINQNSAYLDGSQIYGEHACMARDLRSYGGRLNSTVHPSRGLKELLPISPSHPECKAPSGYCFIAGTDLILFSSTKDCANITSFFLIFILPLSFSIYPSLL